MNTNPKTQSKRRTKRKSLGKGNQASFSKYLTKSIAQRLAWFPNHVFKFLHCQLNKGNKTQLLRKHFQRRTYFKGSSAHISNSYVSCEVYCLSKIMAKLFKSVLDFLHFLVLQTCCNRVDQLVVVIFKLGVGKNLGCLVLQILLLLAYTFCIMC